MPILKDQQVTENSWHFIADDMAVCPGNITVSLKRWTESRPLLLQHSGQVGIRLTPVDTLDEIRDDLSHLPLVELEFPMFNDGRLFSQARLLRDRHGYQGEIRAVGRFLTDQVHYLSRVGVNAFEFDKPRDIELAKIALKDFSVHYQAGS